MLALAKQICTDIVEAGGTPWFVGGYVRDFVMGISSRDIDVEVFGMESSKLEAILSVYGNPGSVGKQYGCYKIKELDFSIPRREAQVGKYHKDLEVVLSPTMLMAEAAKRRDLTINALYMNPFTEAIHDPLGGLMDIGLHKMLKASSLLTFGDDPLRPLRMARFKAMYPQLNLATTTMDVIKDMNKTAIQTLPMDRVFGELRKVLMEAPVPSVFFHSLEAMGLLGVIFPELAAMKKIAQGYKHHPEGNVYTHTMLALDITHIENRELDVMLAILFHDLGKALVPVESLGDGVVRFKGHAEETSSAEVAISRLTLDRGLVESTLNLIKHHMRPYDMKSHVSRRLVRRLASTVDIRKLMKVHIADKLGRGLNLFDVRVDNMKLPEEILKVFEEIEGEVKPLLLGRDLIDCGMNPGSHFGKILAELYELQLEEAFVGREGALDFLPRYLLEKELV